MRSHTLLEVIAVLATRIFALQESSERHDTRPVSSPGELAHQNSTWQDLIGYLSLNDTLTFPRLIEMKSHLLWLGLLGLSERYILGVFWSKTTHPDTQQQPLRYKDKTSRPQCQRVDNQLGDQSPNSSAFTLLFPLSHPFWDSLIKYKRWHWFHLPVTATSSTSTPTKHIL